MTEITLPVLETRGELKDFLYHVKEIVAAQDRIVALLEELDKAFDANPEATAKVLSFLEVEIFDHVGYHIKELRVPFSQFLTSVYSSPSLSDSTKPDDTADS